MSNSCPQVTSLPAFLSLLQLRQNCRWSLQQGVELQALCSERGREVMLNMQHGFQPPGIYQQLLRRRAQLPERYDGCYLCLNRERILSCWCQLSDDTASDQASIEKLFSLSGIALAG
ncbi:HrpV family type III secretion system protein [Erwinia psidii]|uniref:Type III secretion system protein n=1 Tax=Erwinia psidii TaxID=69224 RepID=A0A3N6V391_9GAMM|nr:HrpV family type III secretion system protein [Erwinia psidii]MCX8957618.1 type III secretion system protein [Erwinia psidii]MCX8960672.1 type III secretion system protein [Erwinia psidii]MCX8964083.1 type III secretion system protein [Erwinia psidii]RQM39565.1 type III secretion system protein [Erwinia psidii]